MDHGAQPWGALREALRGHAQEAFAVELVDRVPPDILSEPSELREILRTERREGLQRRMAAAAASGDVQSYQRLMQELGDLDREPRDIAHRSS